LNSSTRHRCTPILLPLNNTIYRNLVLLELRSRTQLAKLPVVIATLRRISPYVFEELVLTCCFEQGWQGTLVTAG
ncbi:hypothetical protein GNF11_35870, partial [Nostoc sp. UCD122]|nr:hypothetical protein [Nostoc sp. UCD122]